MELNLTQFNLAEMLANLCAIVEVRAKQKNLSVVLDTPVNLPRCVLGDEKRLSQVLLNLLSNAVKFTNAGKIILQIQRLNSDEQEVQLRFSVLDNGVGIAQTDLQNIFQAFEQVGEQNRKSEGTGLGLSISRKLVQLMGGDLQVESALGQGSQFLFDLSLPFTDNVRLEQQKQPPSHLSIMGYQGRRLKVLVVDDLADNRLVLKSVLVPLGFEIMEACNGREALEKTVEFKPDLMLTDLVMPVMSGFEMIRRLRQDKNAANLKVVSVSASSSLKPDTIRNEYDFDAAIDKPVQLEELFQVLQSQLNLTWIYEIKTAIVDKSSSDVMKIPELAELNVLYEFTEDGDFVALNKQLEKLTDYPLFVTKTRELAKTYQDKEICAFINHYRQEKI